MNIQIVRQRFSTFLKQFQIEDLKLLMKFLELIVSEYKNSRASRLFDLLSETSTIDIDEFGLSNNDSDEQEDYNKSMENKPKRFKIRQRANYKTQTEKYRRFKILSGRKSSLSNASKRHFNDINENNSEVNRRDEMLNSDSKKESDPQVEETAISGNSHENKERTNSEDIFENENQIEQDECDDIEKRKLTNRSQMRMMDSSKKMYRSHACYNDQNTNNQDKIIGLNNENSNQSMNFLDEESIDKMFENNSTDEYLENEETAMSTYGAKKNPSSRWNIKHDSLPMDSSILMNSCGTTMSVLKGVVKCAVCSDTASGTRYGVCVCEGCKEFFRRQRENSGNRQLYCVNGSNSCTINMNNRTQCRKCRLEKCLKLGMKLVGK